MDGEGGYTTQGWSRCWTGAFAVLGAVIELNKQVGAHPRSAATNLCKMGAKVGGPQKNSAKRKSENLRTLKIDRFVDLLQLWRISDLRTQSF
jgi:hypothetical protein